MSSTGSKISDADRPHGPEELPDGRLLTSYMHIYKKLSGCVPARHIRPKNFPVDIVRNYSDELVDDRYKEWLITERSKCPLVYIIKLYSGNVVVMSFLCFRELGSKYDTADDIAEKSMDVFTSCFVLAVRDCNVYDKQPFDSVAFFVPRDVDIDKMHERIGDVVGVYGLD